VFEDLSLCIVTVGKSPFCCFSGKSTSASLIPIEIHVPPSEESEFFLIKLEKGKKLKMSPLTNKKREK